MDVDSMFIDDTGGAMVEYAIAAAAIVIPLLGLGFAIAQNAGSSLSATTGNLSNLSVSPP